MRASWNGQVVAESDQTIVVEGNHYFPTDSLHETYFANSDETSFCNWKGTASYYDIVVDGKTNPGAAWYYADPMQAAAEIRNHVAFWRGVEVTDS